jgi:hypothetical protein
VFLNEVFKTAFLEEFVHVFLQSEDDLGTTGNGVAVIGDNLEGAAGVGDPSVLLIVVVLGDNDDFFGNEVGGVEADTELTNHADVCTGRDGLHEGAGTGLGDGAEVVDEIGLLHADTCIPDGKSLVGLVGDNSDSELGLGLELLWLGNRLVADLVEGVGGVGNELSEEDLLVGVESVDDKGHQLLDVGVERENFFGHDLV